MKMRKSGRRGTLVALILMATAIGGQALAEGHDEAGFLQGSWSSNVSIVNCTSGDLLAGPFKGFTTFHQGGTLTESREANPTSRGPGHGIWYRSGKRQFTVKIVFQRFDVNGFLIGTQEVLSTNVVSKDSKTAVLTATARIFDNNGVLLGTGCATGDAQRMRF